jgi:hypothetical protein
MAKRDLDEWDREIEADYQRAVAATRAVGKGKGKGKKGEPFAMVPLHCAEEMAKACRSPAFVVCVHLLYLSWKTKSRTVALPNPDGYHRNSKDRVLRKLEAAGLVRVDRHSGRNPRVTILRLLPWC